MPICKLYICSALNMEGNCSEQLVVAGVNFHKSALETRNRFALTTENIKQLYESLSCECLEDFFILSTCNRTEIYGTTTKPDTLIHLLASVKNIDSVEVAANTFVKTGDEALRHLFRVSSGLDSQILGDYEIIGQLKNAFALSKSFQRSNGYLEKAVNASLQASRQVKQKTRLSDGTTSVSFAAIQVLRQLQKEAHGLRVVILGLGKMGALTLKNMRTYLPQHQLTVVNRNTEKAIRAAEEYGISYESFENQSQALKNAEVLIVATGADAPVIHAKDVEGTSIRWVFDLSVPSNVHQDVSRIPGVVLYQIDELSRMVNETLEKRRSEIPLAEAILDEHLQEFRQWELRRIQYGSPAVVQRTIALGGDSSFTTTAAHEYNVKDCHQGKSTCSLANICCTI